MLVASDFSDDITTIGGTMIQYCQTPDDPAYIAAPDNDKQEHGVKPLDRLPAQWWNWFLNQATRRFGEYEKYVQNTLSELNNILSITGSTPSSSTADTDQLQTMFQNAYLQSYLPKVIDGANDFTVDTTHEAKLLVSDDDGNDTHTVTTVPYAPGFIINTQIDTAAKNMNLPSNCPYEGQTIKVLFTNGHTASSASDYMTLDVNSSGTPATVAVNKNGTLVNLPIHEIATGTYSVLQGNTCLEMYYTSNGLSSNPTWVIIGNPVVLSSASYTIYANGKVDEPTPVGTIIAQYKKSNPRGYLYLDGSTYDTSLYPRLYSYLGTNQLPDYREFALVGAEENTTDSIIASGSHDTYTQGQSKNDSMQKITGSVNFGNIDSSCTLGNLALTSGAFYKTQLSDNRKNMSSTGNSYTAYRLDFDSSLQTRTSTVTRGKRKAVFWYIKY